MSSERMFLRFCWLTTVVVAILIFSSITFGHGDEEHEATETTKIEPTDSLSLSQNAILDSIYAIIQNDFTSLEPVLKKGCFDCHTTRTEFPWYYKLPIVKGQIDADITEARKHMDMSNGFPFGGHGKPVDDLVALRDEVVEGEMPPLKYRLMHWSAKPSDSERDQVVDWVDRSLKSLASIGVFPTESDGATADADSSPAYACPMHPEVTSDHEGKCTSCGMALELVDGESHSDSDDHH